MQSWLIGGKLLPLVHTNLTQVTIVRIHGLASSSQIQDSSTIHGQSTEGEIRSPWEKTLGMLTWWISPQFLQRDLLPYFRVKVNKELEVSGCPRNYWLQVWLCNTRNCRPPPPGSSLRGISQARILEWAAISFSGGLPNPGLESLAPALQTGSSPLSHQGSLRDMTYNNVVLSCTQEVSGSQMMN